jgi:hypothetical protein
MDRIGRFALEVQSLAGTTVYIRNWGLQRAGQRGLAGGESLESANVAPVRPSDAGTRGRTEDFLRFLAATDRSYLDRIAATVREQAGPLVPVTGTQMGYGGLMNVDSHAGMDYLDHHFYVDHYRFPHTAWDGLDWTIQNTSTVASGFSPILNVAVARQFGKPYTVSEFNQPWPNTRAAEIDVEMATLGAFQDWDAIMHFAYAHGRNWDGGVPNGFNLDGDWTKLPVSGQSAWLFRSDAIRAGGERLAVPAPAEARLQAAREKRNGSVAAFFSATTGYSPENAFVRPVGIDAGARATAKVENAATGTVYESETGELTYDAQRRLYLIHAAGAAGIIGFPGTAKATAGLLDVQLAESGSGFVTLLVTALDGARIAESSRLLLSLPGASLRSQPLADPARPQRLVNYAGSVTAWTLERDPRRGDKPSGDLNSGLQPTWMERVECFVTLRTTAARLVVYPLDGAGAKRAPLEGAVEAVEGGFRIHLQADGQEFSPWYEIGATPAATAP